MEKIAGIEAGGTKFICAVGNGQGHVIKEVRIETLSPKETMPQVLDFFKEQMAEHSIRALGCGSFGPIDPNLSSCNYGKITSTPKTAWRNFNIVKTLEDGLGIPVTFDTDVNAAALGEYYWGSARNIQNFIYLTVGTGIGGGIMIDGKLYHGAMHPEMGHIFITQDLNKDDFKGICPYHNNCLEGLASGAAIAARFNLKSASDLELEHPFWDIEADYLASAIANYILILSPELIILGGGVMKQGYLFKLIRQKVKNKLNGYINNATIDYIERTIVPAMLRDNAGVIGALALAKKALKKRGL